MTATLERLTTSLHTSLVTIDEAPKLPAVGIVQTFETVGARVDAFQQRVTDALDKTQIDVAQAQKSFARRTLRTHGLFTGLLTAGTAVVTAIAAAMHQDITTILQVGGVVSLGPAALGLGDVFWHDAQDVHDRERERRVASAGRELSAIAEHPEGDAVIASEVSLAALDLGTHYPLRDKQIEKPLRALVTRGALIVDDASCRTRRFTVLRAAANLCAQAVTVAGAIKAYERAAGAFAALPEVEREALAPWFADRCASALLPACVREAVGTGHARGIARLVEARRLLAADDDAGAEALITLSDNTAFERAFLYAALRSSYVLAAFDNAPQGHAEATQLAAVIRSFERATTAPGADEAIRAFNALAPEDRRALAPLLGDVIASAKAYAPTHGRLLEALRPAL
jgi:hypothetical protein